MAIVIETADETGHEAEAAVPRRRPGLVLATVAGMGIGPAVAAGAAVGGSAPPVITAALMITLTSIGLAGLVISAVRWIAAARQVSVRRDEPVRSGPATTFSTSGQRASFALAVVELLIIAIGVPLVLVLRATGPQDGPGKDVSAILVAAVALVVVSALVVPTIAAQAAWTWRRGTPAAEAAVLAGLIPGARRVILLARTVTVTAWVISIAGAGTTSVLLVGEATQRLQAIASAYSKDDAADSLRSDLLDTYVVGDIRCPDSLPDPGRDDTFTCRVTSLGRTVTVQAKWFASGFGTGGVNAADPEHAGLVRIADLQDVVPKAVSLDRDASAAEVVASVRSQLIAEGWNRSSRAVRALRCPSIGGGQGDEAGFVRCTIGRDPETQRSVDVYPVAQRRFVARTAEIADLPR